MSNKTQLQTNNINLDALITRVSAAKDVAASLPSAGGGASSVETCTVIINHPNSSQDKLEQYFVTTYINGEYTASYNVTYNNPIITPLTINNVVCGSQLYLESRVDSMMWGYSTEKAEVMQKLAGYFVIKITAGAGETATIDIYDID